MLVLKKPIEIKCLTLSTTTVGFEFSETDQKLIKYPEKKMFVQILLAIVIPLLDSIYNSVAIWLNEQGNTYIY